MLKKDKGQEKIDCNRFGYFPQEIKKLPQCVGKQNIFMHYNNN